MLPAFGGAGNLNFQPQPQRPQAQAQQLQAQAQAQQLQAQQLQAQLQAQVLRQPEAHVQAHDPLQHFFDNPLDPFAFLGPLDPAPILNLAPVNNAQPVARAQLPARPRAENPHRAPRFPLPGLGRVRNPPQDPAQEALSEAAAGAAQVDLLDRAMHREQNVREVRQRMQFHQEALEAHKQKYPKNGQGQVGPDEEWAGALKKVMVERQR